jgi:CRP/FNR family transcriptional regulator, cyclic AMP receptor protein
MSDARILQMVDIFSDLSSEHLDCIYEICKEKVYPQGAMIIEEYTPSKEFYILLDGEVEILVGLHDLGGPQPLALLDRGHTFGEIALVDHGLRSASVRCVSASCRVFEIDRDDLMALLKEHLEIGFAVMHNLALDLCLRIRQTQYLAREAILYAPRSGGPRSSGLHSG